MLTDAEREQITVELGHRRRMTVRVAALLVVALFALAALGVPLWCLGLFAAGHGAALLILARHYRKTVASCRTRGWYP